MSWNILEPVHPDHAKTMDTQTLRDNFLVSELFNENKLNITYSYYDRMIVGGCMPTTEMVELPDGSAIGGGHFLDRREMGIINIGAAGTVTLDGEEYNLAKSEALYVGAGVKQVEFRSDDSATPAKFYINSAPAHRSLPAKKITEDMAKPKPMGSSDECNERTIFQYMVPDVVETCQLVMGLTRLNPGSIWNTFPCHTHARRMEAYFYFDIDDENAIFHMMGRPEETRHIVVRNDQAIFAPSWSIHCGVARKSYSFIWGMAGENQTFDDMDHLAVSDIY